MKKNEKNTEWGEKFNAWIIVGIYEVYDPARRDLNSDRGIVKSCRFDRSRTVMDEAAISKRLMAQRIPAASAYLNCLPTSSVSRLVSMQNPSFRSCSACCWRRTAFAPSLMSRS